jgi:hypothetical protein
MSRVTQRVASVSRHLTGSSATEGTTEQQIKKLREDYGREQPGGIKTKGLNHLALTCSDMKRTCAFYSGILGFRLTKTIDIGGPDAKLAGGEL